MSAADATVQAAIIATLGTLSGVVITLVGTVVAPMVRESINARSQRERERREKLRKSILEVHAALVAEFAARNSPAEWVAKKLELGLVAQRLELLLTGKDVALAELALQTSMRLGGPDRTSAIAAWTQLASAWFRHELKGQPDLRKLYEQLIAMANESEPPSPRSSEPQAASL